MADRNPGQGRKVKYGMLGLKRGVPKDQQRRNAPNNNPKPDDPNGPQSDIPVPGLEYLSDKQQAAVQKWLGDNYDPTKPLNVQIFQARWQAADQEGRRALAKRISGDYLEGGPTAKTLQGFHTEYLDTLRQENQIKAKELEQRINDYSQNFGGYATSQESADASLAYWTQFANTPEGQSFIQGTGMSTEAWLENQANQVNEGVANYTQQSDYWDRVQQTAAALGQDVPGFKPPGWDSTLAAIQQGTAPVPQAGGLMSTLYPGVASDLAGIDPITSTQLYRNRLEAGLAGGNRDNGGGTTQPATSGASLYPVTTPALGNTHPSITGFDYNDMISEVF